MEINDVINILLYEENENRKEWFQMYIAIIKYYYDQTDKNERQKLIERFLKIYKQ